MCPEREVLSQQSADTGTCRSWDTVHQILSSEKVLPMEDAGEVELLYREYKSVMLGVAYRMLGSVMDAEDIVHEVFLSLNVAALANIRNTKAYLCKIVTNRCLDRLRSTSKQREVYVGPWLPEPLVSDNETAGPPQVFEGKEMVSMAYLLLLQQLSWVERAVFLLREVLQLDYPEIADMVKKSPSNCRQIFHRAKHSLGTLSEVSARYPGLVSDRAEGPSTARAGQQTEYGKAQALVQEFTDALTSGHIHALMNLLSADVTVHSDGGGRVKAAIHPIRGCRPVSMFFAGLFSKTSEHFAFKMAMVNGSPGIVTYEGTQVSSVISFGVQNDRVAHIYIVANPDKLRHVK